MKKEYFPTTVSRENFLKDYHALSRSELSEKYGRSESTIKGWIRALKAEGCDVSLKRRVEEDAITESTKLKNEVAVLRKRLQEAETRVLTSDKIRELINDISAVSYDKQPDWLDKEGYVKGTKGVPVLLMGDWHYDEMVDSAQIGGINEYNRSIAQKRLKHTFSKARDLFLDYQVKPKYPYIVVAFLGDMLSGNIHEELRETNEYTVFQSVDSLLEILVNAINSYADIFGKVFCPCVVGNHGRIDKKPRAKNKIFDNYDWLLYRMLAKQFSNDDRVQFLIRSSPDAWFKIYNYKFLMTHGDQFRGGSGIQGFLLPLTLGHHRKQKKHAAIKRPFDMMITGHFHQSIKTNQFIVNGSGKGYDEWANDRNLPFERPQQLAFILHRHHGIIHDTPVLCDSHEKKEEDFSGKQVISYF